MAAAVLGGKRRKPKPGKVDHTTTSPCKNMNKEQTAEGKLSTADSCKPKSGASSGECAEDVTTSSSTVDSRAGSADPSGLERKDDGAKVIAAGTRMTTRSGAYFSNRYDMNDEDEALLKRMQGEDQEEALHADIKAAVEAETEAVLADFGTEDLTKIVLITIKAAVPAIVKAVQKQLLASNDSSRAHRNILLSRYKEDELEQYSRKENVRIHGIQEENMEETEEILVEKVCKLAAEAGTNIRESDISAVHRLGGAKKQCKTRPVIVRFVSRRKKAELMRNKAVLRSHSSSKNIFISDDLTSMRYKLFKYAKEKCPHTFIKEGKVICKHDGHYKTINSPDDLFLIGYDDLDYKLFGIDI
ncbi:hypothetical protein WMY93_008781 [Mugilogobius chulae]|uniref:Uncharacterized protein n=1 Tax=Mugilogobius chulae TaxID=88201 RepID=A0AAW0PG30_9GOBI